MKILILLFIWFVVEFILWVVTVKLVVTVDKYDTDVIKSRNNKYLGYIKTIGYTIAVLFSMAIGYLLN
jgi:methyl coenzyme M reductase subunit C-like uncharacterized protein (methanogenesis marker protein 7)